MLLFKEPPVEIKPTHEAPEPAETLVEKTDSPPQGIVSVFFLLFTFIFCVYYMSLII